MDRPGPTTPAQDVDDHVAAPTARDWGDDWVHELIEMTRPGAEINVHVRGLRDRVVPFQFDDFN